MRVAVIHDWLTQMGGAERVLERILGLYPQADLYTVVDFLPKSQRSWLQGRIPKTSFIQTLPGARKHYRRYLPLMPIAIKRWNLSGYDLVISSSHAVAKGVTTQKQQPHICYIHSPMRYAWDLREQYLNDAGMTGLKSLPFRCVLNCLQNWDRKNSVNVDGFISNSHFVADRVKRHYDRTALVVPPPVELERFTVSHEHDGFYLCVSRLVPYKKIGLIAEAFSKLKNKKLVIIGDGPEMPKIKVKASANIELLGRQPDTVVHDYLERCQAFVFAGIEDFGIAPLEAQACGKPVIALSQGGCLETLRGHDTPSPSAVFFRNQTVTDICNAVEYFERHADTFSPEDCRANAERFSPVHFDQKFLAAVKQLTGGKTP